MDQRIAEYESWGDLRVYTKHSADPVGRLVLGVVGRADDGQLVGWSDDVCTGLQLVNFLQDVPRDLALGRIYLPAEDRRRFDVTTLDAAERRAPRCLAFEAGRARGLLGSGERLRAAIGGRVGTASASSRAAASPRSTRSRTRAGTSSRGARAPSRLELARVAVAALVR